MKVDAAVRRKTGALRERQVQNRAMALTEWDEARRRTSHAYLDWNSHLTAVHGYFEFTSTTCGAAYQSRWERAGRECVDTEFDQYEVFEMLTGEPLPIDHAWMLRSSVIKDVVAGFEAYVEKAVNEAHRKLGQPQLPADVRWPTVVAAYEKLAADYAPAGFTAPAVVPDDVDYLRTLRHVLTHRRGRLCTEKDRAKLSAIAGRNEFEPVCLSDEVVRDAAATLDAAARRLDPLVWHLAGEPRAWMTASVIPWTAAPIGSR